MKARQVLVAFWAAQLGALSLSAHDFWIEPSTFRPAVGSVVEIHLHVGENFRGEPVQVPRSRKRIQHFLASGPGTMSFLERGVNDPQRVTMDESGLFVIGYRSTPSSITLDAEKFEQYLKEEGLEKIVALRAERGESRMPGREIYSRCAKALISVGSGGSSGYDRLLRLPLELVPEKDPESWRPDGEMPVRLLYQGRPLEGALVVALNQEEPGRKLSGRSDREGRASFRLPRKGIWLIKSVHMVQAPKDVNADWESLWASLTFEIQGFTDVRGRR